MVVFDPTLFPQVEALRRLHESTKKTAQRLKAFNIALTPNRWPQPAPPEATFAPLNLPLPDEVLAPILKLDTSEKLRNAIRDCFMSRITELQLKYTTSYHETCISVMQMARPTAYRSLQAAFLNLYRHQCHILVEKQLPYVLQEVAKLDHHVPRQDAAKTEFNHDYTPILESYFAYNAYPSLPDRLLLARKSMMTPRQIEVWFQNHRTRAKRDGVTLRRISPSTASTFVFDTLIPSDPQVVSPSRSRSVTADIDLSNDGVPSGYCEAVLINEYRPAHVFPTPYTAQTGLKPFTADNFSFKTKSCYWMRSPAKHAPHRASLSVDDLASHFALMTMRGHARPSRGSKSATNQGKWSSPLVVAPVTAPHPAVVRSRYVSPLPAIQTSEPCIWQKPSFLRKRPTCHSHAPYPSWTVSDTLRRRKSPFIPRRVPLSMPNTKILDTSPRSLSSSSSSSLSSNRSRSTSMSSSSNGTTIDLLDTDPENIISSLHMANPILQYYNPSSDPLFLAPSTLQEGVSDLSTGLTLLNFTAMDFPTFTFFES